MNKRTIMIISISLVLAAIIATTIIVTYRYTHRDRTNEQVALRYTQEDAEYFYSLAGDTPYPLEIERVYQQYGNVYVTFKNVDAALLLLPQPEGYEFCNMYGSDLPIVYWINGKPENAEEIYTIMLEKDYTGVYSSEYAGGNGISLLSYDDDMYYKFTLMEAQSEDTENTEGE